MALLCLLNNVVLACGLAYVRVPVVVHAAPPFRRK